MNHQCDRCGFSAEVTTSPGVSRPCPVCCVLSSGSYRYDGGRNDHLLASAEGGAAFSWEAVPDERGHQLLLAARIARVDATVRKGDEWYPSAELMRGLDAYIEALAARLRPWPLWAVGHVALPGHVTFDLMKRRADGLATSVRVVQAVDALSAAVEWRRLMVRMLFGDDAREMAAASHDLVLVNCQTGATVHVRVAPGPDGAARPELVGESFDDAALFSAFHAVRLAALA